MKNNPKTTFIGILILIAFIGAMAAVLMKAATLKEAGEFLGIAVGALSGIGLLLAKDGDPKPPTNGLSLMILFTLSLAFLFSCKTVQNNTENTTTDSTHVEIKYVPKDTTIYLPGDTVVLVKYIECPDMDEVNLKHGKAKIKVKIKDSVLTASCVCEDLEFKVRLYEKMISAYRGHKQSTIITKTIQVSRVPKFVQVLAWIGGIYLLLTIILIILKITKYKIPFL